ncbi:MAG: hypothetical protein CAPSK01_001659 [Candidatus Accumulibacter vicinus]|uniref:Uncharacterized protein n=1 Tax=Candidatus Accumulibacter vicinus TaxID=2954382 RepID=A0A084Y260_9PROT|nr:MAG: hypothetical protein CAPSK01_001659 [Candidatus Accumulibacter vicinus]
MPFADHLTLRRRRGHFHGTLTQQGIEQIPRGVVRQFQQPFVHRGECDLAVGSGFAVAIRDLHIDACRFAHPENVAVGGDLHRERVSAVPNPDLGHAELVGGLGQVHQRRRAGVALDRDFVHQPEPVAQTVERALQPRVRTRHLGIDAPAHGERRHEDVGTVAADDRHFDGRRLAVERDHFLLQHALALDRHQHGCRTERHAHLEFRRLARLVVLFLRNQVDAVAIRGFEPPFVRTAHPDAGACQRLAALLVLRACQQDQLAGQAGFDRAEQEAALVGRARAAAAEFLRFRRRVVGVEAADQTPPAGKALALIDLDPHRTTGERFAGRIERHHLRPHAVLVGHPAVGLEAEVKRCGMQGDAGCDGQAFAVRIVVFHLDEQACRANDRRKLVDRNRCRAGTIERQCACGRGARALVAGSAAVLFRIVGAEGLGG